MKRMLKVSAVAFSISVLAFVTFAQSKDLSGCWTATLERGGNTGTFTMDLKISGNGVTGTLSDPSGPPWQIQNGTLEGNQLTFDVTAPEHGHTKNIHFMGDVGDDWITLRNESRGKQGRTLTFHRSTE